MGINEAQYQASSKTHYQYDDGDNMKNPNLLQFHSSSSDKSTKFKSDNESHAEPIDTNVKGEFDEKQLNRTYSSDKLNEIDDSNCDEKIDELMLGEINDDSPLKIKEWKYRNWFSLADNFDSINWSESLCDLKIENMTFKDSRIDENPNDSLLIKIRNYLAEFQELRGLPREEYTYLTLIKVMSQASGRCLRALFYVIVNIIPVLEIFHHILRFIFDAMINIKHTENGQHIMIKTFLFFVQLISIYISLTIIFGFIVSPVLRIIFGILTKLMFYD